VFSGKASINRAEGNFSGIVKVGIKCRGQDGSRNFCLHRQSVAEEDQGRYILET